MSEKKQWLSRIFTNSQESQIDNDISWTSSDSDTENPMECKKPKMSTLIESTKSDNWIKLSTTPLKTNLVQTTLHEFFNSPVVGGIELDDESPVLTQRESPIISRRQIVRKIRWQLKQKRDEIRGELIHDETSSDSVGLTQKSHFIESVSSQHKRTIDYQIDVFSSQDSSEIISDSLSGTSLNHNLFYLRSLRRRKTFKKGGLASHLQKALSVQSSSIAIWQHEVFLNRTHSCSSHVSEISFEFIVKKKSTEYGCVVLNCTRTEPLFDFLLLISTPSISLECELIYEIFPPYCSETIEHNLKQTLCIFNASRFILR